MRFTIVTPSYNQLDWLRLCLRSVADQVPAGVSLEHIVQDAGTPGIDEFRQEMEGRFPATDHYRLAIISEPDNGMYDAVNRGFRRGEGEIFAYLNCDEQYLPGTLRTISDWFDSHAAEVVFGDAIVVRPDGEFLVYRRALVPQRWHTLVSCNLAILTCATFFRASILREYGIEFGAERKVIGDADWVLRIIDRGLAMETIGKPLSTFVDTGSNLALSAATQVEHADLARRAPAWARWLRPLIVAHYRLRKLLGGGYARQAENYEIHVPGQLPSRRRFAIEASTGQWKR